jgi:hypothetical protein
LEHTPCPNGKNCNDLEKTSNMVEIGLKDLNIIKKVNIPLSTSRTQIHSQQDFLARITKPGDTTLIVSDMSLSNGKTLQISLSDGNIKKEWIKPNLYPELGAMGDFASFDGITFLKYHNVTSYIDVLDKNFEYIGTKF